MMRAILLAIIFIAGCGDKNVCHGEMVSGLCLHKNKYNVDSKTVMNLIETVQEKLNVGYPNLDLPHVLEIYNVTARYVHKRKVTGGFIGQYVPEKSLILVAGIKDGTDVHCICLRHYRTLGHELLHFISIEYIGESIESNVDHTARLFAKHAPVYGESIEGQIDLWVAELCSYNEYRK